MGPVPESFIRLSQQRLRDTAPEPPRKRQRVQSGDIHAIQDVVVEDFVTLVKIDLDLEYTNQKCNTLARGGDGGHRNYISVVVDSIEMVRSDEYHLKVSDMEGNCVIDAILMSDTMGPALEEFQWSTKVWKGNRGHTGRARRSNTIDTAKTDWFLILPQDDDFSTVRLQILIKWRTQGSFSAGSMSSSQAWVDLLSFTLPQGKPNTIDSWSPQDFYRSVHIPNKEMTVPSQIQNDLLGCQLYSFQRRAVRWMLRREGVDIDGDGLVSTYQCEPDADAPSLFYHSTDAEGRGCVVSHLLGIVSTETVHMKSPAASVSGGILAEEMGLGKTVELISLICLSVKTVVVPVLIVCALIPRRHKRKLLSPDAIHDRYSNKHVSPSSSTLIITPPSILQQWQDEIATHAPELKVLRYEGIKHDKLDDDALIKLLLQQDIVLTTYNVLASEIHYAGPTPDRLLRHQKKYIPRRSPLMQISWWRVCLDEAQMVESGVSNAATVARLIPRCNAWAVSGTPVRKDVKDLLGLLIFLRYEPFCDHPQLWNKLVTSFKDSFQIIFSQIALRHTKEDVRDEIRLPPQKRVVITVPFTQIEEQHYTHLFQQMCADCGLDNDGGPLTDTWDPDSSVVVEKMRGWLTRLRQTCLHPEVGVGNRRALGHGDGPLRTVNEVLEVMIDQNQLAIRTEQKSLLMSKIRRGQMLENSKMSREALDIWLQAFQESEAVVGECRAQLSTDPGRHDGASGSSHGRGRDTPDEHEDESDGIGDPGRRGESNNRSSTNRLRLRAALEVQHMCAFFSANAYFQIKTDEGMTKPNSEEFMDLNRRETAMYEKAKQIRKEMLSEALGRVGRLMRRVGRKANSQSFVEIPEGFPSGRTGGIESRKLLENFENLVAALNIQANQLDEWRENVVRLLLRPLVDEDEGIEVQGDEYETSTKEQDSLYVYMETLRAAVADRHDALTGQSNFLIQEEMRVAVNNAKSGKGPIPELLLDLLSTRARLKPSHDIPSMRGLVADLRALSAALRWQEEEGNTRARAELAIAEAGLADFQGCLRDQTKATSALDQELELFRGTMNARLEYYRQLQHISDTVAPFEDQQRQPDSVTLPRMLKNEGKLESKIASLKAKSRYLIHLRQESSDQEAERICVICQQTFEVGALTVCGHQYCKECMRLWWSEHRSCPICKKYLSLNDFHQITYKPRELTLEEERHEMKHEAANPSSSIYSDISNSTLNQIKNIDLGGSFGTKIDTIARHLLWIRENDPGAKSVLFSQYRDFLAVLGRAFGQFRIGFTSMGRKGGVDTFKNDPSIECFLLDAKANSSGLNLVNATHVFLCEPLINTALELQAIARVHRIGQRRPTTVWMYLVDGTVEKSIYEISVSRRISHMDNRSIGASNYSADALERTIDVANSFELEQTPLAKLLTKETSGGEMVQKDDLWSCLFHHSKKNLAVA